MADVDYGGTSDSGSESDEVPSRLKGRLQLPAESAKLSALHAPGIQMRTIIAGKDAMQ
jgi:hypothetical protein